MDSITAVYEVNARNIKKAAQEIVYGQSIGNPYIRTKFDSGLKRLLPTSRIKGRTITVHFPLEIFNQQFISINHIMSVLMGGQADIDNIRRCRLVELDLGPLVTKFPRPQYGIKGIRSIVDAYDRPLVGVIVKPKIGLDPKKHAEVCEQIAAGGADFIKDDEILADQDFCRLEDRLRAVKERLSGYRALYAPCITADGERLTQAARLCHNIGLRAVHFNIWSSLGAYMNVRQVPGYKPALFFQKSGDKVWTEGPFSMDFKVLCQLVNLIGCDFMHVGMYGGYMSNGFGELKARIKALGSTIPSFSCGMTPELAKQTKQRFGNNIMVSAGGYVAGHPKGIEQAVFELRKAVN